MIYKKMKFLQQTNRNKKILHYLLINEKPKEISINIIYRIYPGIYYKIKSSN